MSCIIIVVVEVVVDGQTKIDNEDNKKKKKKISPSFSITTTVYLHPAPAHNTRLTHHGRHTRWRRRR